MQVLLLLLLLPLLLRMLMVTTAAAAAGAAACVSLAVGCCSCQLAAVLCLLPLLRGWYVHHRPHMMQLGQGQVWRQPYRQHTWQYRQASSTEGRYCQVRWQRYSIRWWVEVGRRVGMW
jgi:hypothetical protein